MNNKIKKTAIALAAVLVFAAGCSGENNQNNDQVGNNNDNQHVVDQPDHTNHNDDNDLGNDDVENNQNDDNELGNDGNDNDHANDGEATGNDLVSEIADQVIEQVEMGALLNLDNDQVQDMYGIDPEELLEEGVFMPAMMNVHAHELTIVKLKAEEHFEAVNEAMEQRALSVQKDFERYLQDQYEAAKNYQILRQGDYVLFSITPNQEKVAEIFEELAS